MTYRKKLNPI
uniref:Uncharacterized protein n=1 Tax=Arundo donax TaxID=35708 RepID=A0A0A8ZH09_ARUDO